MSEPTIETPSGRTLINSVKWSAVSGLLLERGPKLLKDESRRAELQEIARGIATEVAYVVGDPPPQEKADRAAWCMALGIAAALESSVLPNQQINAESRGAALQVKYLAVKAELAGAPISGTGRPVPRFSYPLPAAWPDQTRW